MQTCVFARILIIFILITFTDVKPAISDDGDNSDGDNEEAMELRETVDGDNSDGDNEEAMEIRETVDGDNSDGDNEEAMEIRETVDDDSSILKVVGKPLARREFFDLNSLLQRRGSSGFTTNQRQFQALMLEAHNNYRKCHSAAPLTLDDGINRSAQDYAEYLARINQMVHSNTRGLGENLFTKWSSSPFRTIDGTEATNMWYNEIKYYNFNYPGFSSATGHFTQVVWKGSSKLGIGFALTNDGRSLYVVAQYSPPGNVMGQFGQNVLKRNC